MLPSDNTPPPASVSSLATPLKRRGGRGPGASRPLLLVRHDRDHVHHDVEIGVDEAGRGPLLGAVYAAAVVLPDTFDVSQVKDSKLFHSKRKLHAVADYIRTHALAWSVAYEDETVIDQLNILHATQRAMHTAITNVLQQLQAQHVTTEQNQCERVHVLVDGNFFKPLHVWNPLAGGHSVVRATTVVKGDNTYAAIAAASILAKDERDTYVLDLCRNHPELQERYALHTNMGYGTRQHMLGIQQYGLSPWHRTSFRTGTPRSPLGERCSPNPSTADN
jgi:ribonuclease HII